MVSGSNLISIYVALELMALASYVLAGYFKGEVKSTEAALKYFVLGAFSSAVLLYGLSLVYGVGGKMGLADLAQLYSGASRTNVVVLGIILVLAGLLFKIAAVPFHVWTPDVYEGSPTPVTAFFSVGPKVAAYAILARIFYVAFPKFQADWGFLVAVVAAATMIWGNLAALLQTNVKRMFAYSSIAHAGYALLGVIGFRTKFGMWGVLVYLLAYTLMNFGAFCAGHLPRDEGLRRGNRVGLQRPGPAQHAGGDRDAPLPAFAGRYSADRRLHRQVLPVHGGDEARDTRGSRSSPSSPRRFRSSTISASPLRCSSRRGAPGRVAGSYALTAAVVICAAGTLVVGVAPERVLDVLHRCLPSHY